MDYTLIPGTIDDLKIAEKNGYVDTVFKTSTWLMFLKKNQGIEPIVLKITTKNGDVALFVGGVIRKMGIKILGSPFEGWLTCDMGFIKLDEFCIEKALDLVCHYAFYQLKCVYVQIIDKNICKEDVPKKYKYCTETLLYIDNNKTKEEVLASFKSEGRRDVRASARRGAIFEKVAFNRFFADVYYEQLLDVFKEQGLKPFYSKEKIYDLVDVFADHQDMVLALLAKDPYGNNIGSVFTFGYGNWAYFVGAASYRTRYLQNEGLFWEFIKYWNEKKIPNIDLVGKRGYKMKYSPDLIEVPVITLERWPGIIMLKNMVKKIIKATRKSKR